MQSPDPPSFDWFWNLLIYVAGLGLFFLEIFVPSGGIIFVAGTLCVGFALWQLFAAGYLGIGISCIVITVLYLFALVRWGIRRVSMTDDLGGISATFAPMAEAQSLLGHRGEAETALRPAGSARIEGSRYDVVSSGGFIEQGEPITVIEVSGNRIVVRRATNDG